MTNAPQPAGSGEAELTDSSLTHLPRAYTILVTLAAAMFVIAGMRAFAASLGPIFLALVVVVVVHPIYGLLKKRGVPAPLAAIVMATSAFGILALIVGSLIWSTASLISLLASDEYTAQFQDATDALITRLQEAGVDTDTIIDGGSNLDLSGIGTSVANALATALSSLFGFTSAMALLVLTMAFMLADANSFSKTLNALSTERPYAADALRQFARQTRSYFVVSTVFGLAVALADVAALALIGVPEALVWGVLSFITNYIPNVGFVIGLIPPTIVAFFQGGWQMALWVVVAYVVLNTLIQGLLQPKVVGDAVGLSTTLTFLSLIFWGWVMGAIGALLAVPLTLFAKAMLIDVDPESRWAGPLISLRTQAPEPGLFDLEKPAEAASDEAPTSTEEGEAEEATPSQEDHTS